MQATEAICPIALYGGAGGDDGSGNKSIIQNTSSTFCYQGFLFTKNFKIITNSIINVKQNIKNASIIEFDSNSFQG